MHVVSLVPSWTETLLSSDITPVGRTRFCIHPAERVKAIPIVGGTKDWDWEKIKALKPDLLLLDQDENARFMTEQSEIPWHASHITSIKAIASEMERFAELFASEKLANMARRWHLIEALKPQPRTVQDKVPGLVKWGRKPDSTQQYEKIVYMIWRNPWMAASRNTFIGSLLMALGLSVLDFPEKYPVIDLQTLDPSRSLLLFASEPYPFLKIEKELAALPYAHAFVDGEVLSWYGIRSLEFMETELGLAHRFL